MTSGPRSAAENLRDDDLVLERTSGSDEFMGFAIQVSGQHVGTVALRREDQRTGSIRWNSGLDNLQVTVRALKLAVAHAFDDLGMSRLEARVPVDRTGDDVPRSQ